MLQGNNYTFYFEFDETLIEDIQDKKDRLAFIIMDLD